MKRGPMISGRRQWRLRMFSSPWLQPLRSAPPVTMPLGRLLACLTCGILSRISIRLFVPVGQLRNGTRRLAGIREHLTVLTRSTSSGIVAVVLVNRVGPSVRKCVANLESPARGCRRTIRKEPYSWKSTSSEEARDEPPITHASHPSLHDPHTEHPRRSTKLREGQAVRPELHRAGLRCAGSGPPPRRRLERLRPRLPP